MHLQTMSAMTKMAEGKKIISEKRKTQFKYWLRDLKEERLFKYKNRSASWTVIKSKLAKPIYSYPFVIFMQEEIITMTGCKDDSLLAALPPTNYKISLLKQISPAFAQLHCWGSNRCIYRSVRFYRFYSIFFSFANLMKKVTSRAV